MKRFLLFFAAMWLAGMGMMNASTCADLNAVNGTVNNFSLGEVTVVYAKTPYYYVQDATGTSLVYSSWVGFKKLHAGDTVTGINGTAKLYNGLPELAPLDTNYTQVAGTAPAIPEATAVPTKADVNKVMLFRNVKMPSGSFPNGSASNLTGKFMGTNLQFRNVWKEAYQFDSLKTYDMIASVGVFNTTVQIYPAEITEHHEMGFNPIVIGAEKPSAWGAMYLYAWKDNNEGTLLGAWPGTLVSVDSAGWAYKTFEGVSAVNYIWNNGSGVQTGDLRTEESVCQRLVEPQPHLSSGNWSATAVECGSHATQPSDTTLGEPITVRLFPSSIVEGWESGNGVFLYAWTGDSTKVLGNWPGYPVDKVNGWYSYTFPAYIQNVNIIWSNGAMNGANQTEDIMNVTASTCYRLGYRTTMIDDYATNYIHYEANNIDCSAETTLKTMYEVNQAADGTPIAVKPLIVTFAKKPYFYVQDFVGTPGLIYDIRNEWTDLAFNDIITGFEGNVSIYNGLKEMVPSISYVDWNVRNKSQGEEIVIPVATSAPTVADMNKVFRFENVSFGDNSYTTQKKNITVTMANGETFAARNQWGEAYTFEANKTYNFTGCVAVYNGNMQVYVTNFAEYTGSVTPVDPDTIVPQPQQGITVKLLASSVREIYNCKYVNLYAWRTAADGSYIGEPPLGGWPGTSVPLDSATGWYQYTFAPEIQDVNIIWSRGCDGSRMQTQNIMHLTYDNCFKLMGDTTGIIAVGANCSIVEPILPVTPDTTQHDTIAPQEPITVRLLASSVADAGWQKLYLYAWNGGVQPLGEWPGTELYAHNGWYEYSFADFDTISFVWNDAVYAHGQTNDFNDLTASECYTLGEYLGYGTPNKYFDCYEINCNTPVDTTHHDTIPQPVEGITIKLAVSSVPESWEEVRIHSWTNGVDSLVRTGFGLVLEPDSGWYSYTFPVGINQVDFLFNNGSWGAGNQTVDGRAFASTCYGLDEPDETTDYHFPFLLADCVTGEVFPEAGDTSAHMIYIWDNLTRYYYDSIVAPYGADVVLPTDLPEYEGYHFVFWEGLYDGSNVLHNVKTDMYMQAKYYINLPEEPAFSPVTVRLNAASVPESWGQVYIYSWTPGAMDSVRWPGALMQMDDNGWYTYTFPAGVQDIDFLFDNGDGNVGNQTVDVDNVSSNYCFNIAAPLTTSGFYMVYPANCDSIAPQPEGMTIRLMRETNMGGWYFNNYIYAWQHIDSVDVPLLGQWPGAPMQLDDNGWFTYTFQQEYDNINIVFSAGDVQTVDILGVTGSSCFQIGKGNGWINGMYVHNVKQVDCDIQPWQYEIVYFMTNDGAVLDLQYVVNGDSAIAPDAPLIPGYEFVGWDKDISHVTSTLVVYPIYRSTTPVEAYTVRLMPTNGFGWEDIYLYAWTTDSLGRTASQPLGSWPGTKIEKDSLTGWHSYTFEYDPVVNIIWNNGLSESSMYQTQDIMGVSESTCYRLYGRDSLFHLIAEPISCETNLADYRTVAFISGGVQMINQQPVGSHIEVTPTAPYREGYTFAFWADSDRNMADSIIVTEDIAIYAWWSRNSYMVYILDGLTGELIISGEILYGNSVSNLDYFIPEHEGYEFIGWTNDLQYIEGVTFTIAQFRPITYGNTSIVYSGKDGELLDMQNVDLDLPVPPVYDGFTFIGWQVVGGDLNRGIQIQAVYQDNGGTGAPDVNGENRAAKKVLRDNKVFIITPEGKVFSSDGKLVEMEK